MITPREQVMAALLGGGSDRIPFTIYEAKLPACTAERQFRNRGLCLVRRVTSYRVLTPNVRVEERHFTDERGRSLIRTRYETPRGALETLAEPAGFTRWMHERFFKTKEDYAALRFLIEDARVEPDYASVARISNDLGEDFVVRDNLPLEPLQALISQYMGTLAFCEEWMERRDEVLGLFDALVTFNRRIYPIVAAGPLSFCNYGGNVVPQIIGPDGFRTYYVPHYNEAAEVLHRGGKRIGTHLDADNTLIMEDVAGTTLDYIEAYDPGMGPSLAEARRAWPGKVIWINWPSAWHLRPPDAVHEATVELIRQAGNGEGFIIGITEDVPEDRWRANYAAILDGIDEAERMRAPAATGPTAQRQAGGEYRQSISR